MNPGFVAFLRKELGETLKTWRLWVLPGLMLFTAVTAPIITKATPAILRASARSQPGVVITFPPPTAIDAYIQFLGNLTQLVLLAVVIVGAAMISSERKAGTVVLVLTKPLSRAGFVLAKAVSALVLLAVAALLAAGVCIATTVALFGSTAGVGGFVAAVGLWLLAATMLTSLMLLLSAAFDSQAAAAGAGLGVFISLAVLTAFPLTRDATPAGLLAASGPLLRHQSGALLVPVIVGTALTLAFVALAVRVFGRKEL